MCLVRLLTMFWNKANAIIPVFQMWPLEPLRRTICAVLYISTMGGEVVLHKVTLKYVLHLLFILILKAGKVRPEQLSPSCVNIPIVLSLSCSLCPHWSTKRKASSLIAVISWNPSPSTYSFKEWSGLDKSKSWESSYKRMFRKSFI